MRGPSCYERARGHEFPSTALLAPRRLAPGGAGPNRVRRRRRVRQRGARPTNGTTRPSPVRESRPANLRRPTVDLPSGAGRQPRFLPRFCRPKRVADRPALARFHHESLHVEHVVRLVARTGPEHQRAELSFHPPSRGPPRTLPRPTQRTAVLSVGNRARCLEMSPLSPGPVLAAQVRASWSGSPSIHLDHVPPPMAHTGVRPKRSLLQPAGRAGPVP